MTTRRRVLVFGASGHTGRHVVAELVARNVEPVLVARDPARLATDLPVRRADVGDEDALRALVEGDDVVISTVGPFHRLGHALARTTARAGACYLDSTGEPPFIRWMFENLDKPARASGAALVPAFGYDFVPGNLAGASAATRGGPAVRHIEIGYFLTPGLGQPSSRATLRETVSFLTGATRASMVGVLAEPAVRYLRTPAGPSIRTEPSARRIRAFTHDGVTRCGISIGGSEHFGLPRAVPALESVDVYLGWFDRWSRTVQALSIATGPVLQNQFGRRALTALSQRLPAAGGGPTRACRTLVIADALNHGRRRIATVALTGPEPYALTGRLLAEAAVHATSQTLPAGVHAPVTAFGLDTLARVAGRADLVGIEEGVLR